MSVSARERAHRDARAAGVSIATWQATNAIDR
jgi:hypothetical protein